MSVEFGFRDAKRIEPLLFSNFKPELRFFPLFFFLLLVLLIFLLGLKLIWMESDLKHRVTFDSFARTFMITPPPLSLSLSLSISLHRLNNSLRFAPPVR